MFEEEIIEKYIPRTSQFEAKMIRAITTILTLTATVIKASFLEISDFENNAVVAEEKYLKNSSENLLCKKAQHIIENQHDLHEISSACSELDGSIVFQNYVEPNIDLNNIKIINGDFVVEENNAVVSIHGDSLEKIGGTFNLYDLTSLNAVSFPKLHDLNVLHWRIVPILSSVALDNNIKAVKSITISDSSLTTLHGFDKIEKLETFNVNNNRYLESISTSIKYISRQLSVSANADELDLDMSNLIWANNVTIRDTKTIKLDKLQYVNQSLEFIENTISSLELSSLKAVGGTLGIIENKQLSKVDFNNVSQILGGLMISNNDALDRVDFFNDLRLIGGAIQFKGNIKDTDFPNLRLVKGSAIIQSLSDELDCTKWVSPQTGSSIIRGGKIECESKGKKSSASVRQDGTVLDRTTDQISDNKQTSDATSCAVRIKTLAIVLLVSIYAVA